MPYQKSSNIVIVLNAVLSGIGFILVCMIIANIWVVESTQKQIFFTPTEIPAEDVALILGTSKYTADGNENPFFRNRMYAAALLYYKKKVKHLILSGDNALSYYNEPSDMRKALMDLGVPDSVITLDYAGFRTFDSVVRCKKVFGQSKVIIVSQKFHLHRALFIANAINIKAYGYTAEAVERKINKATLLREYFARCLVILDLYFTNKSPKFLGKKENIPL